MNLPMMPVAAATMSSLLIAEITGKRHDVVLRDIRETLEQAEIGAHTFEGTYTDSQNKSRPCYNLPRRECDLVVSGYSVKYRLAIIDRWHELESKQALDIQAMVPTELPGALRLAADLADAVAVRDNIIAEQAPKVEFYDRVTESNDAIQLAVVAQVAKLPFGRNILFQKLREKGFLITGGDRHNMPMQQYVTAGLFTVNQRTIQNPKTGEPIVIHTTYATQKGLAMIVKRFGKSENEEAA